MSLATRGSMSIVADMVSPGIVRTAMRTLTLFSLLAVSVSCATRGAVEGTAAVEPLPAAPEDPYESISLAMAVGDVDAAIAAFELAYSKDPDDPETKVLYSTLLIAAGKLEEARSVLTEILEEDPGRITALYNLALLEGATGNRVKKRELLRELLELDPENPSARTALGEMYLEERNVEAAAAEFRRGIEADPDNAVARIGYANTLLREDRPKEALEQLDRAVELSPGYPFAYVDRSRARMDLNDMPGAELDLSRAVELDPEYYWNYIDRGRIRLFGIGDWEGALEDFDRAVELRPDYFYAYVFRAGIYDQEGRIEEAVADYLTVLERRPDYFHAYIPLGVLLYLQEDWEGARTFFDLAYRAVPEDYGLPIMAALSMRRAGLDREARKYLEREIPAIPRDSLYWHMARLYMEHGYDGYMTGYLSREKDQLVKTRLLYYLAAHYLLTDRERAALSYLLDVADEERPDVFEVRLARHELARRGVKAK